MMSTGILNNFSLHCCWVDLAFAGSASWICRNLDWNDSQGDQNEEDSFGSHFAREWKKLKRLVSLVIILYDNTYQRYVRNATKVILGILAEKSLIDVSSEIEMLPLSSSLPEQVDDSFKGYYTHHAKIEFLILWFQFLCSIESRVYIYENESETVFCESHKIRKRRLRD